MLTYNLYGWSPNERNDKKDTPQIRSTILALYKLVCKLMYVCMYLCRQITSLYELVPVTRKHCVRLRVNVVMRPAVSLARDYGYHIALERYCGFAICTALNREAVAGHIVAQRSIFTRQIN